jgi:hypothetical protein
MPNLPPIPYFTLLTEERRATKEILPPQIQINWVGAEWEKSIQLFDLMVLEWKLLLIY